MSLSGESLRGSLHLTIFFFSQHSSFKVAKTRQKLFASIKTLWERLANVLADLCDIWTDPDYKNKTKQHSLRANTLASEIRAEVISRFAAFASRTHLWCPTGQSVDCRRLPGLTWSRSDARSEARLCPPHWWCELSTERTCGRWNGVWERLEPHNGWIRMEWTEPAYFRNNLNEAWMDFGFQRFSVKVQARRSQVSHVFLRESAW